MLGRMFPSAAEGGASKDVGLSVGAGLVGVTMETGGTEPGKGGVKPEESVLSPGLFNGAAVGEASVRLA